MTIAEIAIAARKEGLTYGQYVQKYMTPRTRNFYVPKGAKKSAERENPSSVKPLKPDKNSPRLCVICGKTIPGVGLHGYASKKYCSDYCYARGVYISRQKQKQKVSDKDNHEQRTPDHEDCP